MTGSDHDRPPPAARSEGAADDTTDPGWRRGPDPDAPPWAGRERPEDDEREDEDDRRSEDTGPSEGDGSGRAGPTGSRRGERAPDADEEGEPVGEHVAIAPLGPAMQVPRPPRRTGVFLDPDELRSHVGGLLRAILGGYEVDAFGNFTFLHEGARVFVTVGPTPIGPQVGVFSVTNLDVDLTPDLARFLLTTNHTLGFGSFSYDPSNRAVWLRHTLLGTTLDLPELQTAVAAVATTAAGLDDAIKDRFGGRTFQEAPSEVQRRVEPPEPRREPGPPNVGGYL